MASVRCSRSRPMATSGSHGPARPIMHPTASSGANRDDQRCDEAARLGPILPFPHQSAVRGSNLRELRPRSGRSAWRALYRHVGARAEKQMGSALAIGQSFGGQACDLEFLRMVAGAARVVIPPTLCVLPGILDADGGSAPGELWELLERDSEAVRAMGVCVGEWARASASPLDWVPAWLSPSVTG